MISKYTCVENIDDDLYAIYNRLLFKPIFANNKEVSMIMQEEVDNSIANVLYEKGIYVDENKVDEIKVMILSFNNSFKYFTDCSSSNSVIIRTSE